MGTKPVVILEQPPEHLVIISSQVCSVRRTSPPPAVHLGKERKFLLLFKQSPLPLYQREKWDDKENKEAGEKEGLDFTQPIYYHNRKNRLN